MRKFLISTIAIIFVLSLAVGSVVMSYNGGAKVVVEGDYIEAAGQMVEDALGAIVSPFVYTKMYFNGGAEFTSGDVDFVADLNGDHIEYGDTPVASSTVLAATTLLVSQLTTYGSMDYTVNQAANTLTLPATSTMTSIIEDTGKCFEWRLRNVTATAASSTTIAAGTGMDLVENENGDVVIEGGNEAQIRFCRELDTDVTVYVDEYVAAD